MQNQNQNANYLTLKGWDKFLPLLLIIVFVFCLYGKGLNGSFVHWDDVSTVYGSFNSISLNDFTLNVGGTYQPLRDISYKMDYLIFGKSLYGIHLTNLLLYLLNVIAIFFIAKLLFNNIALSCIATCLFAVHPVHAESISWIMGRKELLVGLFSLFSFYFYIKGKNTYYLAILCFILALLSKPTAIMLPFVLLAYDAVIRKKFTLKRLIPFFVPAFVVAIYFIFFCNVVKLEGYAAGATGIFLMINIAIAKYAQILFFPFNLSARYIAEYSQNALFLGLYINIGLMALLFYNLTRKPLISFAVLWIYLWWIPTSNIIPISTAIADRYIYLSSFGFIILFVCMVQWLAKLLLTNGAIFCRNIIFAGFILFFSILTYQRVEVWNNDFALWSDTVTKSPSDLSWNGLGNCYVRRGNLEYAKQCFERCVYIQPNNERGWYNLGVTYLGMGKMKEAVKCFKIREKIERL